MVRTYELSNQTFLGTPIAHTPFYRDWFLRIVRHGGYDGIQHMPVRLAPGLRLTDQYLSLITSLHQAWRGPFAQSRNKVLALKAIPFIPSSTSSITMLRALQMAMGVDFPAILYPETNWQPLNDFQKLVADLRGKRVIQAEAPHLKWFNVNPAQLQQFYQRRGWYNCIDLVHFTKNMPAFEAMVAAMREVTTHVHVRTGRDQQTAVAAARATYELLEGRGANYERLRLVARECEIEHVTIEVPLQSIMDATGIWHPSEQITTGWYSSLLKNVRKAFGN